MYNPVDIGLLVEELGSSVGIAEVDSVIFDILASDGADAFERRGAGADMAISRDSHKTVIDEVNDSVAADIAASASD